MTKGVSLDLIKSMGFEDFGTLNLSLERLDAAEKLERTYANMMASQASGKEVRKWCKQYEDVLSKGSDDNDIAALMAKVGAGI